MNIGLRNNNPLNIRKGKSQWKGQRPPLGGGREGPFCQFETMEWGLRAAFCLLRTYSKKYKATCIRDIVTRWAPPNENNTQKYIRDVCMMTGFGGNQRLTETDWPKLVKAMAKIECGAELSDATINRAFQMYLMTD